MSGGSCQQILSSFLVSSLAFIGFLRDGPWGKAPQQLRALGALEPGPGPFEDSFQVFQLDRLDSILEHSCSTSSLLASVWRDHPNMPNFEITVSSMRVDEQTWSSRPKEAAYSGPRLDSSAKLKLKVHRWRQQKESSAGFRGFRHADMLCMFGTELR